MTAERGATGKSAFGSFLASPWTAVISVVVALVIIAAGIVAVKNHNSTPAAPVAAVWGDTAPSDFAFDLAGCLRAYGETRADRIPHARGTHGR